MHSDFQAINDTRLDAVKDNIRSAWENVLQMLSRAKDLTIELSNPAILSEQLRIIFRDESKLWQSAAYIERPVIIILSCSTVARNNLFFVLVGLGIGATGGIFLGMWMARPHFTSPVMKAIVCVSFKEDVNMDSRELATIEPKSLSIHQFVTYFPDCYAIRC